MTPAQAKKQIEAYKKQMDKALDKKVAVGLPEDKAGGKVYKDGQTVMQIAAKHEFGYGVPRRSFIREPINTKKAEIEKTIDNQMKKMFEGTVTADQAFGIVGVKAVNVIMDAFSSGGFGKWKPLAKSTIEAKGSSAPLIDTGTLRNSITWEVR